MMGREATILYKAGGCETHFIPKQLLLPLEKEIMWLSSSEISLTSQRSGLKTKGSVKTDGS